MNRRRSRGQKIFAVCNGIFLTLFGFVTLYPFWYVLVASFNSGRDFLKGGVYFWPRDFTLQNYEMAFKDDRILPSLFISVSRTLIGTVLGLLVTAILAYALSVKTLPGKSGITFLFYFTTLFSGGMIPFYIQLRNLGLTSSFWLYIFPGLYGFMNFVLMRTNFNSIPEELRESAQLDGAGDIRILFQIYLPISTATLATLALLIGVGHWNDWFTGAYYQSVQSLKPASTVLQQLLAEATANQTVKVGQETALGSMTSYTSQSLQMAFVMILTMPIVVVYPFLQKYYVKGMVVGSVKG